jgi:periplasmic protein TonB
MANQGILYRPSITGSDDHLQHLLMDVEQPVWRSLYNNVHDLLFPEKLPPLKLTSRPVRVREIWGETSHKKSALTGSVTIHAAIIVALVAISIAGKKVVQAVQQPTVQLIAPNLSDFMPMTTKPEKVTMGGGGGGGDHDKLQAPKGRLPKTAMVQYTPPAVVVRNENPKMSVEPTVVIPPNVKVPQVNVASLGDPMSHIAGPPSNGTGSGGGIGSGTGGGIGSGEGPGVGPGRGGGIGGGVFRVGGGVSAPRAISTPDPEYSEEARKAKYQGVVVLWLIVDQSGNPRDIKVARSLGMGLDQKAIEAVRKWKFEPAQKDGKPVAVQINVEVNFRLY